MLDARQRVILSQLLRPPYLQRWVVLLVVVAGILVLTGTGLARVAGGPAPDAVEQGALQAAPAPVGPAVRTATAAGGRTVALTFDDGPDPVITPQVLDLLAQYDAPATFCTVTQRAMEHWRLVRRIVAQGHRLCDHTSDHDPALASAPPADIARAMGISRAELIAAAGGPGVPVSLFRAPQGAWSPALAEAAATSGMTPLGWSVDTRDWTGVPAATIVATVQRDLHDGGVILLHDGGGPRAETVGALRELLPWLRDQGYRIVLPDDPAAPAAPDGAGSAEPDEAR